MGNQKSLVLLILPLLKIVEGSYKCTQETSPLCYIKEQTVSSTEPFIIENRNSSGFGNLVFSDGYMPQLPKTIFKNYPDITFLSISNMSVNELIKGDFENAAKLISMLINIGMLTSLSNETFKSCGALQSLQIMRHQISFIDDLAFQGLDKLENLYLSKNRLTFLNPKVFTVLPNLFLFSVQENLLTYLDPSLFIKNFNLKSATFSQNMISSIPEDLFQSQSSLSSVYFDRNQLTSVVSFGANIVDVSNNSLVNFTVVGGEKTIHIKNNNIRKLACPNKNFTVTRLYAENNELRSLLCIRDMINLTDLYVNNNRLPQPRKNGLVKLTKLRMLWMHDMKTFKRMLVKPLTALPSLYNIKVDQLAVYKNLNKTLPKLDILGLTTTSWNCTYVKKIYTLLKQQGISMLFNVQAEKTRCSLQ